MKSERLAFVLLLVLLASSFGWMPPAAAQSQAPRPHIVYIVSDDQGLTEAASQAGPAVIVLQGLVLMIAVALVVLGRKADSQGWLS